METNEEKEPTIYCVGVDEKIHRCKPYEKKTLCGISIKSKKEQDTHGRFSCYECTF